MQTQKYKKQKGTNMQTQNIRKNNHTNTRTQIYKITKRYKHENTKI